MEQHDSHVFAWRLHDVLTRFAKTLAYLAAH